MLQDQCICSNDNMTFDPFKDDRPCMTRKFRIESKEPYFCRYTNLLQIRSMEYDPLYRYLRFEANSRMSPVAVVDERIDALIMGQAMDGGVFNKEIFNDVMNYVISAKEIVETNGIPFLW